jgi:HEAT repeat protein
VTQVGQRALARGDLEVVRATRYSLGAVVGHMAAHDAETAAQLNHALVDELKSARSTEDKRDALRAIGNAGLAENVPLVLAELDADDSSVRAAAAAALRKTARPETTRALLVLAGDGAEAVSAEALDSLRGRDLDDAQGAELAALLPRLSVANQPQLADLLIEHLGDGAWAARALQDLADRTHDPRLSARIRALFASGT